MPWRLIVYSAQGPGTEYQATVLGWVCAVGGPGRSGRLVGWDGQEGYSLPPAAKVSGRWPWHMALSLGVHVNASSPPSGAGLVSPPHCCRPTVWNQVPYLPPPSPLTPHHPCMQPHQGSHHTVDPASESSASCRTQLLLFKVTPLGSQLFVCSSIHSTCVNVLTL